MSILTPISVVVQISTTNSNSGLNTARRLFKLLTIGGLSRKVANLLVYELVYRHMIPHKAKKLDKIQIPPLSIEGLAPQHAAFSSERYGAKLNANLPLTPFKIWEEGVT